MVAFRSATKSPMPFLCPSCRLDTQQEQIACLTKSVEALEFEATSLRSTVDSLSSKLSSVCVQFPAVMEPSWPANGYARSSYAAVVGNQECSSAKAKPVSPSQKFTDRKSNLVVYGLHECPDKTPRHERLSSDTNAAVSLLSSLSDDITSQSVRDCFRLGKYQPHRHRPILVKMNRVCDVSMVLANRSKLSEKPNISVKADMSPTERKSESILLRVRWDLITSGIARKSIKIRYSAIYVDGVKHGVVKDLNFELCEHNSDLVPIPPLGPRPQEAAGLSFPNTVVQTSIGENDFQGNSDMNTREAGDSLATPGGPR